MTPLFVKHGSFLFVLSALSIIATGCVSKSDSQVNASDQPVPAASPSAPVANYAVGWNQVLIMANYAKTTVDRIGHWATTRNACGKDADGAIELQFWNQLADSVNKAIAAEPLAEARCTPLPADTKMDGSAEVGLEQHGIRTLLDVRGDEICTTIKDEQVASKLIEVISKIVEMADKEDCPNGWGSG